MASFKFLFLFFWIHWRFYVCLFENRLTFFWTGFVKRIRSRRCQPKSFSPAGVVVWFAILMKQRREIKKNYF